MTPTELKRLKDLIAKWRREATRREKLGGDRNYAEANIWRMCAYELEYRLRELKKVEG